MKDSISNTNHAKSSRGTKPNESRFFAVVEWLGNLLPHPVTLFVFLIIAVLVISGLGQYFGVSVLDPRPQGSPGRTEDGVIHIVSLLNVDGLIRILTNMVNNFVSFPPLGITLVALLGVGIAEKSGLISGLVRLVVLKTPKKFTTLAVVFAGVLSSTASELGYLVLVPLSAVVFHSIGRHPLAGLAAAFAGVSGGYSANIFISTVDPILSGLTQEAASIIDPSYRVGPESNWYLMFVSAFLISFVGYFITEKIIEPRLGKYDESEASQDLGMITELDLLPEEKKGLVYAGLTFIGLCAILALSVVPDGAILRNPETGIINSPFLKSIVVFIFFVFAITGIVYGMVTKTMRSDKDVIKAMTGMMNTMGLYLVIVFFAAQFLAFFRWTNLGQVIAIKGAEVLRELNLDGGLLFIGFIIVCALLNLLMASASAKWALTAPIFVPMFMLAGYAPEITQAAYRIGDSVTNIISPVMGFFALIMVTVIKYKKDAGTGALISLMLPYSLAFLFFWSLLFYVWVFVLELPVGPGANTFYTP